MYEYAKVICLFCEAAVEGAQEYMLAGKRYDRKGGRPERWLKGLPEHKWAWNGLTSRCGDGKERSAQFFLCPEHQTDADYRNAFAWATKHSERLPYSFKQH